MALGLALESSEPQSSTQPPAAGAPPRVSATHKWVAGHCGRKELRRVLHSQREDGVAYLPERVLCHDKPGVSVMLATPLHRDPNNSDIYVLAKDRGQVVMKIIQTKRPHLAVHAHAELSALEALGDCAATDPESHVVGLIESFQDGKHVYLIMPYMEKGDLFDLIHRHGGGLPEDQARKFFVQMITGLLFLKRHGLAHGDVSLENVMLTSAHTRPERTHPPPPAAAASPPPPPHIHTDTPFSSSSSSPSPAHTRTHTHTHTHPANSPLDTDTDNNENTHAHHHHHQQSTNNESSHLESQGDEDMCALDARLIDLGSSCFVYDDGSYSGEEYSFRGKHSSVPPEMVDRDVSQVVWPYAMDVWALGVCLYTMLTGRPLYTGPSDQGFGVIQEGRLGELLDHYAGFGLHIDPTVHDLLCSMLKLDPTDRPTLDDILQHPWVT